MLPRQMFPKENYKFFDKFPFFTNAVATKPISMYANH